MQGFEKSLERAAKSNARWIKIQGAGGTGKTQAILERIAQLLESGRSPQEMLVLVSTASAADAFCARAQARLGEAAANLDVRTPRDTWTAVLASDQARQATGRHPRLLDDFEQNILMEDMKATGLAVKRLREMLKFFYREWTEMGDEQEGFLIEDEEIGVHDIIKTHLRKRNAMLPQELSNLAYGYLRDHSDEAYAWQYPFVFADDFQNYNKASQLAIGLLSKESLMVCGNVDEQVATPEPYPFSEGFASFEETHEGTEVYTLSVCAQRSPALVAVCNELSAAEEMDSHFQGELGEVGSERDPESLRLVRWSVPNEEFLGVARYVKHLVEGTDGTLVRPHRIFIAVPNALWGRAISKVLRMNDVKTTEVVRDHALSGDPRTMEKCSSLRAFAALNLAAEPDDLAAWRDWCAFGDYLCHSNHWCRLEEYADEFGIDVLTALRTIAELSEDAEPAFLGADVLASCYRSAQALIERSAGKRGFSLLSGLLDDQEQLPDDFKELLGPVNGVEDAATLLAQARSGLETHFAGVDAVRIGLPSTACGQTFDVVVVTGLVDGFYPPTAAFGTEYDEDYQRQIRSESRRALYALTSKAQQRLVLSCFQKDESNTAKALGMWVRRIRMENGESMAVLSASCFVDELGDSVPGFDSKL